MQSQRFFDETRVKKSMQSQDMSLTLNRKMSDLEMSVSYHEAVSHNVKLGSHGLHKNRFSRCLSAFAAAVEIYIGS